jgi:hypothetical protein
MTALLPGGKPLFYMPESVWNPETSFLVEDASLPGLNV